MKRVKMLKSFGIWPIMVFDGGHLPMKRKTEEARRK
jgi:5'-3' exonuclease